MRRWVGVLCFLACGVAWLDATGQQSASSQTAPPASGLIVGQVVDSRDGSGVPGAHLTLTRSPTSPGPSDVGVPFATTPIIADSNGRFVFHSLRSGSYTLRASAGGFISSAYMQTEPMGMSQPLELSEGQRVTNVTIRMWRYASISGTVRDETGEPLVGQRVMIVRRIGTGSARRYSPAGNTADTDDRGLFRFSGLYPGDYVVVVPAQSHSTPVSVLESYRSTRTSPFASPIYNSVAASGGNISDEGVRVGDIATQLLSPSLGNIRVANDGKQSWVYTTTFHPAATTPTLATPITVASGDEKTGADVSLKPVPATTVRGRVMGPNGPGAYLTVKFVGEGMQALQSPGSTSLDIAASAITREDGTFTAVGVPTGTYDVSVLLVPRPIQGPSTQTFGVSVSGPGGGTSTSSMSSGGGTQTPSPDPVMWSRTSLVVGATPIEGVALQLAAGATVSGRIEFETGGIPPPPDVRIQAGRVGLSPIDGLGWLATSGSVAADRTFRTTGYPPGRYFFSVSIPSIAGWYVKSVTSGGRDLRSEPVDLTGADISGVVVTYTDKAGEISGTVTRSESESPGVVLLFPATFATLAQNGMLMTRMQATQINKDGAYRIANLVQGDYVIVAINDARAIQELDNQAIAALGQKGARVTLGPGERRAIALSITPVKQP